MDLNLLYSSLHPSRSLTCALQVELIIVFLSEGAVHGERVLHNFFLMFSARVCFLMKGDLNRLRMFEFHNLDQCICTRLKLRTGLAPYTAFVGHNLLSGCRRQLQVETEGNFLDLSEQEVHVALVCWPLFVPCIGACE